MKTITGPEHARSSGSTTFIGNLQWRFTPSARFAVTQQVYTLKADYGNSVIDGRIREEGNDRDLTWRGTAEWHPKPAHFVEFGAQAQSLNVDADRSPLHADTRQLSRCDKHVVGRGMGTVSVDAEHAALGFSRCPC